MRAKNYYFGLFISNLRNRRFEKYFSIMPKQIKKFWVYQSISFQNRPMGLHFNSSLKECWFSWNKKSFFFYINNILFVFRSSILTHAFFNLLSKKYFWEISIHFPYHYPKNTFKLILFLNFFLLSVTNRLLNQFHVVPILILTMHCLSKLQKNLAFCCFETLWLLITYKFIWT